MLIKIIMLFWVVDLLFPLWGIALTLILMRKGLSSWKAWGIVSSFFVTEVYLVGTYLGYNLGMYFFFFISAIPEIVYEKITQTGPVSHDEVSLWFWILPPVVLIIIPMLILYLISKYRSKQIGEQTSPQSP